ncbi:8-oxo-dGTP diphosphatase MutT [Aliidiomarina iranensis]|uniref:8-oxo-dGTP diphosphatase n=1 Tax=Aliidiomarina iranensis TaxID=1434071 RepID=A0A432W2U0_9GAMM|nr:8-oxo-dGTP diphosphatase MutT [Aliidiomarina iranensis]RUO23535.1 8-oxo-dGTP diphosphatase MutT [Aliidiomarina iranensis]
MENAAAAKETKKHVHVAVAVVLNRAEQVLVSKRAAHQHQGGLWEFPGGKVEAGETVLAALDRELHEELNLRVQRADAIMEIKHNYSDKQVLLDVWLVQEFSGEVQANEGQQWLWADLNTLQSLQFPAANVPILESIEKLLAGAH